MAEEPSKEDLEKKKAEEVRLAEEQKKLDEEQKEEAEKDKPIDTIDKANEAAERLERANKKHETLVEREEKLEVNRRLGGDSEVTPKQSQEDKDTEAAQKLVPKDMLDLSAKAD